MSNDNGLIDELEKVEKSKAELEQKEEDLKKKIIELAHDKYDIRHLYALEKILLY